MSDGAADLKTDPPSPSTRPFPIRLYRLATRHYKKLAAAGAAIVAVLTLLLAYLQTAHETAWYPFDPPAPSPSLSPGPGGSPSPSSSASPGPSPSVAASPSGSPVPVPDGGPNPNPPVPNPPTTNPPKPSTYLTSQRYPFTLNDQETVQFHGNGQPSKGAPGDWGDIIYKDVDHQLNFYRITDTGSVDNPSYDLCHANANPFGAIKLDGVSLQHAFCRPESVVDRSPAIVVYVRVTDRSHISDPSPSVSLEVWFMTKTG
jgi:hypothetical protein